LISMMNPTSATPLTTSLNPRGGGNGFENQVTKLTYDVIFFKLFPYFEHFRRWSILLPSSVFVPMFVTWQSSFVTWGCSIHSSAKMFLFLKKIQRRDVYLWIIRRKISNENSEWGSWCQTDLRKNQVHLICAPR
jgi:hypothetical protein